MNQILFGFFHQNIDAGIVSYAIWNVIPIPILIFAAIGSLLLAKRKQYLVLTPIAVGLAYWILYAFISQVIIIEYARIVAIVPLLFIIPSGVGIEWVFRKISKPDANYSVLSYLLLICAGVTALYLASTYPASISWSSFVLHQNGTDLVPSPPVNRHLTPDDLKIFSAIHGARFIAPPWKGLVIGVATGNYALETKQSTISANILAYSTFMAADCRTKTSLSETYSIDYVYGEAFVCPGFSLIGSSTEGLHLYRYAR
jgi:hypothetical protein